MLILGIKKRKRLHTRLKDKFKEIADMYLLKPTYLDVKKDIELPTEYYLHSVEEICKKYAITVPELQVILHSVYGQVIKICEFCGHKITYFKNRTSGEYGGKDDCECKGICKWCNKIYRSGNNDSICYTCLPYVPEKIEHSYHPENVRFRLLNVIGNHEYLDKTDLIEIQAMIDICSEYLNWFNSIKQSLLTQINKDFL